MGQILSSERQRSIPCMSVVLSVIRITVLHSNTVHILGTRNRVASCFSAVLCWQVSFPIVALMITGHTVGIVKNTRKRHRDPAQFQKVVFLDIIKQLGHEMIEPGKLVRCFEDVLKVSGKSFLEKIPHNFRTEGPISVK